MKSLSLSKPLAIIVIGLPGSGKSFFARQFSETFSAPMVSLDVLRYILYGNETPNKGQQTKLEALAEHEIQEYLKTQKTFVIDGLGLSKPQRVNLRKKCTEAQYGVLLVWVQTDEATAKYRSMKRSNKKKDDQYNFSLTGEEYDKQAKKFGSPATNEQHVVISGKHTYATQAKVVLKRLVAPRSEANIKIVNHENRAPDAQSPRRNVIIR